MVKQTIRVIGGGLAGCEAAWQIAQRGLAVHLYEMKPHHKSPAHELDTLAELVCSNSLRADRLQNAVGLLKAEMRLMNSLVMACADKTAIPAGGALAVDREQFFFHFSCKFKINNIVKTILQHTGNSFAQFSWF